MCHSFSFIEQTLSEQVVVSSAQASGSLWDRTEPDQMPSDLIKSEVQQKTVIVSFLPAGYPQNSFQLGPRPADQLKA